MAVVNSFGEFRSSCESILRDVFKRLYPEFGGAVTLEAPPSSEFGELSTSVCFELSKSIGKKPLEIAQQIVDAVDLSGSRLVRAVKAAGAGYVNFYVNFPEFAELVLKSVSTLGREYGFVKTEKPARMIVEHTSVNPIHPIHVGQARNPVLGDSVARMLKARGNVVSRHYYVDDVGRQSAVIAYGYEKLGKPEPDDKSDRFIGRIYAITSCVVEIRRLKKAIDAAKGQSDSETLTKSMRDLDDWTSAATELESAHPQLFAKLLDKISADQDPEARIAEFNLEYERGKKKMVRELIRRVSEFCLEGFKQSLSRLGISYDSWDWESDFVWNGDVAQALRRLGETSYVSRMGGILEFDANGVVDDLGLRAVLGLSVDYEVPSLTLVRADGTTLYTTRDVAYNLWKFGRADVLVNVVGVEQKLAQLHLKVLLAALGHVDEVKRLRHFAYNLVSLPGFKMSSRTGRYVSLDEVMDEAVRRAYDEVVKRSPQVSEDEKKRISEVVGIGAIKFALVQVDPSKPVVFTWDRVLDFEKNSAPYVQYSYARAGSILRKAERKAEHPDYALLKEPVEHELILLLSKFGDVFVDAAENLRPNMIADYVVMVADKFNTFYNALPVIKAKPEGLSDARLVLVDSTRTVIRSALDLLGIEAPEKM